MKARVLVALASLLGMYLFYILVKFAYVFWYKKVSLKDLADNTESLYIKRQAGIMSREIGIALLLIVNFTCLAVMPSQAMLILGKNGLSLSPYVFFGGLLFLAEIVIYSLIYANFSVGELAIGGVKLSKIESAEVIEYKKTVDKLINRYKDKLFAQNKIFLALKEHSSFIFEEITRTENPKGVYIERLKDVLEEYQNLQQEKENDFKIDIYWKSEINYDKLKEIYSICQHSTNLIRDNTYKDGNTTVIEEVGKSIVVSPMQSRVIYGEIFIIVLSHKEDQILDSEAYIIQNIIVGIDELIFNEIELFDLKYPN